jgi:hypothetical protein
MRTASRARLSAFIAAKVKASLDTVAISSIASLKPTKNCAKIIPELPRAPARAASAMNRMVSPAVDIDLVYFRAPSHDILHDQSNVLKNASKSAENQCLRPNILVYIYLTDGLSHSAATMEDPRCCSRSILTTSYVH